MPKTKEPRLAPRDEKVISMDDIVVENLIQLRDSFPADKEKHSFRRRISRPQFAEELKERGLTFEWWTQNKVEHGRRSLRVNELAVIARYFDVPMSYFFLPPAIYLDRKVEIGGEEIEATDLFLEQLFPKNIDYDILERAKEIAHQAIKDYGYVRPVQRLYKALEELENE